MTDTQIAQLSQADEIPCLLVPVVNKTLLMPTVTVAEMAPMLAFTEIPDTPNWMLGRYPWREQWVPLLNYEVLNGESKAGVNPHGRVAVLNNTGISDELPFIAIVTEGIPRMSRVGVEDITEDTQAQKRPFDLMHVKVGLEELVIPDVAALEQAYLDLNLS